MEYENRKLKVHFHNRHSNNSIARYCIGINRVAAAKYEIHFPAQTTRYCCITYIFYKTCSTAACRVFLRFYFLLFCQSADSLGNIFKFTFIREGSKFEATVLRSKILR